MGVRRKLNTLAKGDEMKTRTDLRRAASKWNATLTFISDGPELDVEVEAPAGKLWACDDLHALVGCQDRDFDSVGGVYADLLDRMESGLTPCTAPGCEWCGDK